MRKSGLIFLLFCLACAKEQAPQIILASFSPIIVCETTTTSIPPNPLQNSTGQDIVIAGAAISAGTDPEGNFSLDGILINSEPTAATGGALSEITIPAGASYSFQISYKPKTAGSHTAIIDVVYSAPTIEILQIQMDGAAAQGETAGCVNLNEGGNVSFDGAVTLTVNRLVAATSKLSAPLSSDDGIEELTPVPLTLNLDLAAGTALLPEVTTEGNFILPLPGPDVPVLGGCLQSNTVITTTGDATGTYDATTGSIELTEMVVNLDTDFNTTIEITLTTDEVSLSAVSPPINSQAVQAFGDDHFDSVGKKLVGSRIDPETGVIALVGTSRIESSTLDEGGCDLTKPSAMRGASLAILIEGVISSL